MAPNDDVYTAFTISARSFWGPLVPVCVVWWEPLASTSLAIVAVVVVVWLLVVWPKALFAAAPVLVLSGRAVKHL